MRQNDTLQRRAACDCFGLKRLQAGRELHLFEIADIRDRIAADQLDGAGHRDSAELLPAHYAVIHIGADHKISVRDPERAGLLVDAQVRGIAC